MVGGLCKWLWLPVLLDGLLDSWPRLLEIVEDHHGDDLQAGVEGVEPGLRQGGNLRSALHVHDEKRRALAVGRQEIRRLGLEVIQNRTECLG